MFEYSSTDPVYNSNCCGTFFTYVPLFPAPAFPITTLAVLATGIPLGAAAGFVRFGETDAPNPRLNPGIGFEPLPEV